jgi:hypothetical protein
LPPPRRVPPPPPAPTRSFEPPAAAEPDVVDDTEPDVVAGAVDVAPDHAPDDAPDVVDEVVEVVPPKAAPVVEQEINRLGSVPDLFSDDDSPIELPTITPSGSIIAHVHSSYTPVLSETYYVPPPTRPATSMLTIVEQEAPSKRKSANKPKRHLLRSFMTLVVLFGLLAGGAFAAKKYLLKKPAWTVEMKPLADEVAAARGLEFKEAVVVSPLPVAEYATRLSSSAIDAAATKAPEWRALGLVSGELDFASIGSQAMNDEPAFYDAVTKTIVVSDDLATHPHLYRFAMRRALTSALLDQQFDWSTRIVSASPAAAFAIRAVVDGDALAVANALAANDDPAQLAPELLAFVQAHGSAVAPSQYAANLVGRSGVAMRPLIVSLANDSTALAAFEKSTPTNDSAFDAARAPATVPSPAGTQGMMFWYYVLASRIDDSQAWSAATRWTGDTLTASTATGVACVDATVATGDPDSAAVVIAAFSAWAAAAPAESTTTVAPIDGNQLAIHACDPGATVAAATPARVPVVFGGAGAEQALVQAAAAASSGLKLDPACLVTAARLRGVALVSPADDAPVLAVGWQSAYVAANLDLAAGCIGPPAG